MAPGRCLNHSAPLHSLRRHYRQGLNRVSRQAIGEKPRPISEFRASLQALPETEMTIFRALRSVAWRSSLYVNTALRLHPCCVQAKRTLAVGQSGNTTKALGAAAPEGVDSRKRESADKPGSVVCRHSSGMHVAVHLMRPTRGLCGPHVVLLFGLAPNGVYRAAHRCRWRGALLPHPFTLTHGVCDEPWAVCSLLHFP